MLKPDRKYNPDIDTTIWFLKIMADDKKRRSRKEYETAKRLSNILLSDKILDNKFCKDILPKIIDQYTSLTEENSEKFLQEYGALQAYELWYLTPAIWAYEI